MITVVMPCYILNEEGLTLTKEAIASLGNVELIIIDNASTIGGGYLRSVADVYVRNKINKNYAGGVNQGLKLARTRLTAVANSDIRVSPNWQEITEEIAEHNFKAGSIHLKMTDYNVPFNYGSLIAPKGKERWCTGSFFVLIKHNTHYQLYDENFINSYDDWDYWLRVRNAGWQTIYTNKAVYQHNHSFTQKLIPEREENNKKNAEYFIRKWGRSAEEMFAEKYPEQMKQNYWEGFE